MHIYVNLTIYGKYMLYIDHIWYNCTPDHSQKLPIIYERGLVVVKFVYVQLFFVYIMLVYIIIFVILDKREKLH